MPSYFDLAGSAGQLAPQPRQMANTLNGLGGAGYGAVGLGGVSGQLQELEDARLREKFGLEQRYMDVLEQRLGARDRILDNVNEFGQSQITRTNQDYTDLLNNVLAGNAARGLGTSTLDLSGRLGVERQKQQDIQAIEDNIISGRVNAETGLEESLAQYQERIAPELTELTGFGGGSSRGGYSRDAYNKFGTGTRYG